MWRLVFFIAWAFLNGGLCVVGIAYASTGYPIPGAALTGLSVLLAVLPPIWWFESRAQSLADSVHYDRAEELRLRVQSDIDRAKRRVTAVHGGTVKPIREGRV